MIRPGSKTVKPFFSFSLDSLVLHHLQHLLPPLRQSHAAPDGVRRVGALIESPQGLIKVQRDQALLSGTAQIRLISSPVSHPQVHRRHSPPCFVWPPQERDLPQLFQKVRFLSRSATAPWRHPAQEPQFPQRLPISFLHSVFQIVFYYPERANVINYPFYEAAVKVASGFCRQKTSQFIFLPPSRRTMVIEQIMMYNHFYQVSY